MALSLAAAASVNNAASGIDPGQENELVSTLPMQKVSGSQDTIGLAVVAGTAIDVPVGSHVDQSNNAAIGVSVDESCTHLRLLLANALVLLVEFTRIMSRRTRHTL